MTDTTLPNLAGIATPELVETIGTGKFTAAYINWARTVALLRQHAPGWLPELVIAPDGYVLHPAPVGAYLLIRFRNGEQTTPPVPQAVMDSRNNAIPLDRITARDITDTHRRGVCMAAAFTFGLAYELWAKLPLESGYDEKEREPDIDSIIRGIANAASIEVLKGHFQSAMQMLPEQHHQAIVAAKDKRKRQLESAKEGEPA